MGSSENVLGLIKKRAAVQYPNIEVFTYSPPYKKEFSDEDNAAIVAAINAGKLKTASLMVGIVLPT